MSRKGAELWTRVGAMSPGASALWCLALAAAIELFTCLLRFGFGLEAQQHGSWLAPVTFGWRVHHGCYGVVLLVAGAILRRRPALSRALLIVGGALFLSDMIHHFLVLWPITGSPEFYIRYGGQALQGPAREAGYPAHAYAFVSKPPLTVIAVQAIFQGC